MWGRLIIRNALLLFVSLAMMSAAAAQSRIALVIGNGAYQNSRALPTVAGDSAVVAETMRAAGYDVVEARDVVLNDIGYVLREFLDKVAAAGPQAVAYVYFAGYAAQAQGENFLVPIDAKIDSDEDVQYQALRLNDLIRELMALPAAARLIVLDAARDHGFGRGGPRPVPQGLALMDLPDGMLLASSAAPGAVAIDGDGPYSIYTTALVTFMRQPGLDMEQIFKATRVQVNQVTSGRQTPWMASSLTVDLKLFDAPAPAAAAPSAPPQQIAGVVLPPKGGRDLTKEELRRLGPNQAYQAVIEEDGLEAYQWFVELYPDSDFAAQVWKIIDDRREAVLWRRTLAQGTRNAYWNYLKRYPDGEHATEAEERLSALAAARRPPATYVPAPEPLPPDYYDEAVGIAEVYPNDAVSTFVEVFEAIAPLFITPPRRRDFGFGQIRRPPPPPPPPPNPNRNQAAMDTRTTPNRDGANKKNQGGVRRGDRSTIQTPVSPTTPTSQQGTRRRPDEPIRPTTTTPTIPPTGGRPTTTTTTPTIPPTGGRPTTTTTPTIPPTGGRPTTTTTPTIPPTGGRPTTTTTPTIPPTGGRPTTTTTPTIPPTGGRPTTTTTPTIPPTGGRPTTTTTPTGASPAIPPTPQTGGRPTTPGATPTIPSVPQTGGRPTPTTPPTGVTPTVPPTPQTGGRPTTPGTAPTIPSVPQTGGRPLPPPPGTPQTGGRPTTPVTPTVPSVPPTGAQRPVAPAPTRPTAPALTPPVSSQRPGLPPTTARPTATPAPQPPSAAQRPGLPPPRASAPPRPTAPAPQRVAPPPCPAPPPPRVSAPPRPVAAPPRPAPPPPRMAAPPPRPAAPPPRPAAPPPRPACPPGKRC